jgi:hypothetical protein
MEGRDGDGSEILACGAEQLPKAHRVEPGDLFRAAGSNALDSRTKMTVWRGRGWGITRPRHGSDHEEWRP